VHRDTCEVFICLQLGFGTLMASITRGYGITDLNDLHPLDLLVSLRKTLVVQLAALRQEKLHPAELLQQQ